MEIECVDSKKRRLGIISKTALFCCGSERTSHGKIAAEEIGVRPIPVWWRRGELNPCPKTHPPKLLRAHSIIYIPSSAREPKPLPIQ